MQTVETMTHIPLVDLKKQYDSIKGEVDAAIKAVIEQTAFVGGPYLKAFEEAFARYCGVKLCVGVANGTDAIFIALKALGIGAGDEVITVANSFIATSEAIKMAGAQVVFVDCDPSTYTIDVSKIEAKITPKTKAIVPVHLYGQPADMDPILALAKKHGLRVIGDAAQAHGATYKGRPIAELADITCYSFYPGKNLGAYGDAGALVTDNETWAANARMMANHGRTKKYDHDFEGVNSRLDGIQAAILSVKLKYLQEWTEARRRWARLYSQLLANTGVVTPTELPDVEAVYHLYVIRIKPELRDKFQEYMQQQNIATGIHYPIALPNLSAYQHLGHKPSDFPVATKLSAEIVSLPIFAELSESDVRYVCDHVARFMSRQSR